MINFIKFAVALAGILIVTSFLLDHLMGIFIVCLLTCVFLNAQEKEKDHKKLDK
jgi:hypothetical protein